VTSHLTVQEAAASLGRHESTIKAACQRGSLKGERKGGRWLIPALEVARYRLAHPTGERGRPKGTKNRK
jgi:excisionase family DNA binding protein